MIRNAGGFRKLRFAPPPQDCGKSGAVRVIYLDLPLYSAVLLAVVYAKNEVATVNAAGKKQLRAVALAAETELEGFFLKRREAESDGSTTEGGT